MPPLPKVLGKGAMLLADTGDTQPTVADRVCVAACADGALPSPGTAAIGIAWAAGEGVAIVAGLTCFHPPVAATAGNRIGATADNRWIRREGALRGEDGRDRSVA